MSQHLPTPEPTDIAGRYQVIQKLGAGAFGTVYKAKDRVLGRMLAIKTIRLEGLASAGAGLDELLDRFKREAQVSAQLKHPHIVTIYDIGDADGLSYLAMEFIDGVGLEQLIKSVGRLPVERAAAIGAQVADALDFAHRNSVVHRDIKPANIMIEAGDRVKVADFGIAKVIDSADHLTMTGSLLGTPSYMSPEQARGGTIDGRSDIFSLGCVLYEMITGKKAFRGESITALIFKIITEDPVPLHEELPGIPEAVSHIIMKALSKAPETRYQSGHELAEDLLALTRGDAMPTLRQTEVATAVVRPGAATLSSQPTAMKAGSSTQPLLSLTLPASTPSAPQDRTQGATSSAGVRRTAVAVARPAGPQKSRTGLVLGLLAAGMLFVLAIGSVGAYFLFLRPKPHQGGSGTPGGLADAGPPLSAPPVSTPPVTVPPDNTPPATVPLATTPPATAPPVTTPDSRRADTSTGALRPPLPAPARDPVPPSDGADLSALDRQPSLGAPMGRRPVAPYGSGYRGGRQPLERRQRYPDDATPRERAAIWVLLNVASRQEAYRTRNGRYGSFAELLPGLIGHSFVRHGYRFEATASSEDFKIVATPLTSGSRALVVDDSGTVDYPDE